MDIDESDGEIEQAERLAEIEAKKAADAAAKARQAVKRPKWLGRDVGRSGGGSWPRRLGWRQRRRLGWRWKRLGLRRKSRLGSRPRKGPESRRQKRRDGPNNSGKDFLPIFWSSFANTSTIG